LKAFSAYPKLEISLLIAGEIGAETRLEKELMRLLSFFLPSSVCVLALVFSHFELCISNAPLPSKLTLLSASQVKVLIASSFGVLFPFIQLQIKQFLSFDCEALARRKVSTATEF